MSTNGTEPAFCTSFAPRGIRVLSHNACARRAHGGVDPTAPRRVRQAVSACSSLESGKKEVTYEEYMAFCSNVSGDAMPAEPELLKWSDIDFRSIQEELDAIEEYERNENFTDDDPWPKFLRGAAYEHWGQPQLALAQYELIRSATGFKFIPELWDRRAYNAFKVGQVLHANAYFDISSKIANDADGNSLHMLHWFYETFNTALPKNNGPPAPMQNGMAKYCVGKLTDTREILAGQIAVAGEGVEHALLFFMAASFRLKPHKGLRGYDIELCDRVFKQKDRKWDKRLGILVLLFTTAGQSEKESQAKYLKQIEDIIEEESPHIDITTNTYMALYHDAFSRNVQKRDAYLDAVSELSGSMSPNNIENFLYHVAKNRLSVPPGCTELPLTNDQMV